MRRATYIKKIITRPAMVLLNEQTGKKISKDMREATNTYFLTHIINHRVYILFQVMGKVRKVGANIKVSTSGG